MSFFGDVRDVKYVRAVRNVHNVHNVRNVINVLNVSNVRDDGNVKYVLDVFGVLFIYQYEVLPGG